jgi:UDP-N-acetylglucosamine--N-acetylmuramyl-(pentapeptide) pyrophosphoryl-undecaprenol N-acetylglucosamine transferase
MQAIAEALLERGVDPEELRFVGSRRGQEATLLGTGPVGLTLLPGRGLRRSLSPGAMAANFGAVWGLTRAIIVALAKVGRWRPSVVVSVGGYASFATSLAAFAWRRPLVLVQLDATPSAANRLFTRYATTRCTAFPTRAPRAVFTGAPLRKALVDLERSPETRARACASLTPPLDPSRTIVVVMTGSLGASSVNRATSELAARWSTRSDLVIVHVSGRRDFDDVRARVVPLQGLDYRVVAFGDMVQLWQLCDVAVCRAGATTLAELTALGIASILVPLPGAPGDHQTKNARILVDHGAARLLSDANCNASTLAGELEDVMQPETRQHLQEAAKALGRAGATANIADIVLDARSAS